MPTMTYLISSSVIMANDMKRGLNWISRPRKLNSPEDEINKKTFKLNSHKAFPEQVTAAAQPLTFKIT